MYWVWLKWAHVTSYDLEVLIWWIRARILNSHSDGGFASTMFGVPRRRGVDSDFSIILWTVKIFGGDFCTFGRRLWNFLWTILCWSSFRIDYFLITLFMYALFDDAHFVVFFFVLFCFFMNFQKFKSFSNLAVCLAASQEFNFISKHLNIFITYREYEKSNT